MNPGLHDVSVLVLLAHGHPSPQGPGTRKHNNCHAVNYGRHLVRHGDSIPLMLTSPSRDLPPCLEALGSLVPWKVRFTPMLR